MEERIFEYLDAAESALVEFGPQAAEGMLLWARIDAASGLILCGAFMIFALILAPQWLKFYRWAEEDWFDRDFLFLIVGVPAAIIGGLLGILALFQLLNVWRWVGIFAPEMWLVHKAISAIGG